MKKLYLSLTLAIVFGHLTSFAQVRPGVIGGANIASYSETVTTGNGFGSTSTSYSSSAIFAYHTPSFTNEVNAGGTIHLFNFGISVGYLWP